MFIGARDLLGIIFCIDSIKPMSNYQTEIIIRKHTIIDMNLF